MNPYELGLREAQDEELDALILRAEKQLPSSFTVHSLLSVGFRMKIVDRTYSRIFIPVNNEIPFFIIIIGVVQKREKNNLTIYWNPEEIALEDAKTLMKSLPNWDWEQPVFFNNCSLNTLNEVEKIMLGKSGLCNGKLHTEKEDGYTYTLTAEPTNNKNPGEEIFISKLDENYAPLVFKYWPFRCDTLEGFRSYMKALPSMGAFAKIDPLESENHDSYLKNGNGISGLYKPVAWTVCKIYGEIGFTYTLPEYRNKGLCTAVTLALAKELKMRNITPFINITSLKHKAASIKAHENMGFRRYCTVGYHIYVPDGCNFHDF